MFFTLAQRVQLVAGGAGRCGELVHGFVVVVAQLCQILPGLDDRLARRHSDAAHGSTDGNGLPVYFVEVSRDVVHRLPEEGSMVPAKLTTACMILFLPAISVTSFCIS